MNIQTLRSTEQFPKHEMEPFQTKPASRIVNIF